MKLFYINLIIIPILFSCLDGYSQDNAHNKLFEQEIEITPDNIPIFKNELNDFYKGEKSYDLIFINLVGGSSHRSQLKRVYNQDDKWIYTQRKANSDSTINKWIYTQRKVNSDSLTSNTSLDLKSLFDKINKGSYIAFLPYDTSNSTYIYLIRSNGKIVFQLICPTPYNNLNKSDLKLITNAVQLFSQLPI